MDLPYRRTRCSVFFVFLNRLIWSRLSTSRSGILYARANLSRGYALYVVYEGDGKIYVIHNLYVLLLKSGRLRFLFGKYDKIKFLSRLFPLVYRNVLEYKYNGAK